MLFPTHLLAGYAIGRRWELPTRWTIVGAGLPDLVDKPLAMAGVSRLYHTIGHSFLAVLLCLGVAVALSRYRVWRLGDATVGTAAAILVGWSSHLALDAAGMVLNGRPGDVRFLAWPVVRHTPEVHLGPVAFLGHYRWTPAFVVELGLWIAVGVGLIASRK